MHRITAAAILLGALSGCEIITGIKDTTLTEDAGVPDAQVETPDAAPPMPDAAVPDAFVPDAGPLDSDMDGVFDDEDNCLMVENQDQYDEDADGVGDACDNCPSMANVDQADELEGIAGNEADGVGDACDPRPTLGGDSIILFDAFNDTLSPAWQVSLGGNAWTVENGRLKQSGTNIAIRILYWAVTTAGSVAIDSEMILDSVPDPVNTNDHRSAGVFAAHDTATSTGYGCTMTLDANDAPPSTHGRVIRQDDDIGWTYWTEPSMVAAVVGERYPMRLVFDAVNDKVGCTVSGPDGFTPVGRLVDDGMHESGFFGVRTLSVGASFEYITVYELGVTATP